MAGPGNRYHAEFFVPPGEAIVQYAPVSLARRIKNLVRTPEGTLRSISGPCPYEPDRQVLSGPGPGDQYGNTISPAGDTSWTTSTGDSVYLLSRLGNRIHGVFHSGLLAGRAPMLIVRAGKRLYQHCGWYRAWRRLQMTNPQGKLQDVTLTDESRPVAPDQFVVINGLIVYSNGIDGALVIRYDGLVTPLGFNSIPGAPTVEGPDEPSDLDKAYQNSGNYSWPGRIGSIGDLVDANEGAVLDGEWFYQIQWQDIHGNLSPLSARSNSARIRLQRANEYITKFKRDEGDVEMPVLSTKVDHLQRQFIARTTGAAPAHAVGTWLGRTPDIRRFPAQVRSVEYVEGLSSFQYADNIPDSRLGQPLIDCIAVPVVHSMVSHAGSLVISHGPYVWKSQPGFPGTFPRNSRVAPSPDGAVVTALVSHAGRLIAFTRSSMVDITGPEPSVLARGIGCRAMDSIRALPDGRLVWLSRDGFYAWAPGMPMPQLISSAIHRLIRDEVSRGSMVRATAHIDPETREYICFLSPAGRDENRLGLVYDGQVFKELALGYNVIASTVTDDDRHYSLIAAHDGANYDVFVMGREIEDYVLPSRVYSFELPWMRGSEAARVPINVHSLYLGLVDEIDDTIDVFIKADGSFANDEDGSRKVRSIGTKFTTNVPIGRGVVGEDLTGTAILGTSKVHARRLYWRQIPVGLENVFTWTAKIVSANRFHIAAIAIETSQATMGDGAKGRIPFGEDE